MSSPFGINMETLPFNPVVGRGWAVEPMGSPGLWAVLVPYAGVIIKGLIIVASLVAVYYVTAAIFGPKFGHDISDPIDPDTGHCRTWESSDGSIYHYVHNYDTGVGSWESVRGPVDPMSWLPWAVAGSLVISAVAVIGYLIVKAERRAEGD